MPKPNYAFEKRQRELAKKKKKEEKAARKAQGKPDGADGGAEGAAPEDEPRPVAPVGATEPPVDKPA